MSVASGIARSLAEITEPLLLAVQYREAMETLLADLGWRLELTQPQADALAAVMPAITELQDLAELAADPDAEAGDWVAQALDLGAAIFDAVRAMQSLDADELATLPAPLDDSSNWLELALDLPEYLLLRWMGVTWRPLYSAFYFAGVIEETPRGNDLPPKMELRWDAVETLLTDPAEQIRSTYNWGGNLNHARLVEAVARIAICFGFPVRRSSLADYLADGLQGTDLEQLSLRLARARGPGGWYEAGLLAAPTASGGSGPVKGVLLATEFVGPPPPDIDLGGGWGVGIGSGGPTTVSLGVRLLPSGVELALDGTPEASVELFGEPAQPWTLIGAPDGTRLELDSFRAALAAQGSISNPEIIIELDTGEGFRLVIEPGEGDSFISDIFGGEPLAILAAFSARWSSVEGLTLAGSAGLEVAIPIGITVGPLSVLTLHLAIVGGSGGLETRIGVSGVLAVGPFAAAAENVGVKVALAPAPEGENGDIGPLDVSIGFLPPTGFGFAIAMGVIEGGGFLSIDKEKGEYAGILDLQFVKFGLTAIGLISTQLPDGSNGWSIFFSLSLRLTGIQLGFGFTLNGVGGLAGLNRGMDVQALQEGLSTGAMDSVLFPEDPIANAPTILANLDAIFPAQVDQYVFGPVLAIGWGTPTLIEIQLGVIVQLPDPITIALLGSLDAILPDKEAAVVELHFAILGVADLTAGTLSIDASLYDSQIIGFSLSGDMALRASFKENPTLLLAVGGFHPDFTPPTGFPSLRRMTIGLDNNPVFGMYFECYGAITSNTVQFGAAFEIWAKALGFVAEGGAGFDALIQFNPFKLKTSLDFYVTVRAGNWELVSVSLFLELTGPNPWRGIGTATFKFLGAKKNFHVDESFGRRRGEEPAPVVHVLNKVVAALEDAEAWRVEQAEGGSSSTTPSLTADPEAAAPDGVLRITQNIAPFGVEMTKYAEAEIDGPTLIELSQPRVGSADIDLVTVTDWFAPAQFTQIKPKQRVSAPSFELFDAGVELSDDKVAGGEELPFELDYETILIDKDLEKAQELPKVSANPTLAKMLLLEKPAPVRKSEFELQPETWTVADARTGVGLATAPTFAQAAMQFDDDVERTLRPAYELEVAP